MKSDNEKLKEIEWIRQHTLTREQTKQLILDKFKRAEVMHSAFRQREMLIQKHC